MILLTSLLNQQIAQADDGGGNVAGTGFNRVGPRIPRSAAGPQPGQQRLDRLARLVPTLELHGTERTGGKDLGAKQMMLGAEMERVDVAEKGQRCEFLRAEPDGGIGDGRLDQRIGFLRRVDGICCGQPAFAQPRWITAQAMRARPVEPIHAFGIIPHLAGPRGHDRRRRSARLGQQVQQFDALQNFSGHHRAIHMRPAGRDSAGCLALPQASAIAANAAALTGDDEPMLASLIGLRTNELAQRGLVLGIIGTINCNLVGGPPDTGVIGQSQKMRRILSIGIQTGPLIGAQKGPLWRCGEQARGGVAFQLAQPTRACVSEGVQARVLMRQLSLPVSTMSQ